MCVDLDDFVSLASVTPTGDGCVFGVSRTVCDNMIITGGVTLSLRDGPEGEREVVCEAVECPIPHYPSDQGNFTQAHYIGNGKVAVVSGESVYILTLDSREWEVQSGVLPRDTVGDMMASCALENKIILSTFQEYPSPLLWEYDVSTRTLSPLPSPPTEVDVTDMQSAIMCEGRVHFMYGNKHTVYTPETCQSHTHGWEVLPALETYNHTVDIALMGRHIVYPDYCNCIATWDSLTGAHHSTEIPAEDADIYHANCCHLVPICGDEALLVIEQDDDEKVVHLVTLEEQSE
ncbi:hypothetical protein KIPB_001879 [Kipferlia bialata]|uniref:Uncharacterized protein n=1 Tax=Kipferlia bialata TaxID=797122 RepID=A0A9K3CPC3_9EUKA|nr:hypothetical protein KIPB_001879 [Kipferlia bialata]|eukprot:g1879.t1